MYCNHVIAFFPIDPEITTAATTMMRDTRDTGAKLTFSNFVFHVESPAILFFC